jgi:hypothetical protein
MRNRALHDALREFALEAAAFLTDEARAGAELEFEVVEHGKPRGGRFRRGGPSGPSLYRYRPLTERFIAERWPQLAALPTCIHAGEALGVGAAHYLRGTGLRGAEAEPALQAMLERLYEDATGFPFPEERFERVYREVERTLYHDTVPTTVTACLPGLQLEPPRVELGGGLALVRAHAFEPPPEALWPDEPSALCLLEYDAAADDPLPALEAAERFRRLVTGLRLFKAGGVTLDPIGWRRASEGRWHPVPLEEAGAARGEPWVLLEGEEAELCQFLEAFDRSTPAGTVAWALARFEMGCSRGFAAEALSDYLLALRALLDVATDAGRASLALRLAALCAEEGERRVVQRRVELAVALERLVMEGALQGDPAGASPRADDAYLEEIGSEPAGTLIEEIERHLRALLRDVLCGYLERDLQSVADDILLDVPEPLEIEVRDARGGDAPAEAATTTARRAEADTTEMEALAVELRAGMGPSQAREREPKEAAAEGVTPSAEWAPDEDAESYSAPV